MKDLTYQNITEAVVASISSTEDPRLKEILTVLVRRTHEFVKEVELSPAEWERAMGFLLRAADISGDKRNEFIILSDLLGVSSLVDLIQSGSATDASEQSLLGPFYVPGAPLIESGGDLIKDNEGERIVLSGRVVSTMDEPVRGALLDIWQNAANGLYSTEDPGQSDDNLRCRLRADSDGTYSFSTIKPIAYKVPGDGASGEYQRMTGRHGWRPAHIHARVSAEGFEPIVTEIFDAADAYIEEDAVFGVRSSLAVAFDREPTADELGRLGHVERPFHMVDFNFRLRPLD